MINEEYQVIFENGTWNRTFKITEGMLILKVITECLEFGVMSEYIFIAGVLSVQVQTHTAILN